MTVVRPVLAEAANIIAESEDNGGKHENLHQGLPICTMCLGFGAGKSETYTRFSRNRFFIQASMIRLAAISASRRVPTTIVSFGNFLSPR